MPQNELQHHGIKGMRWGVRRYQNYDGTRTSAGKKRYASRDERQFARYKNKLAKKSKRIDDKAFKDYQSYQNTLDKVKQNPDSKRLARKALMKNVGAFAVSTALTAVGSPVVPYAWYSVNDGMAAKGGYNPNAKANAIPDKVANEVKSISKNSKKASTAPTGKPSTSTRITGNEEAEIWKALAKQYEEEQRKKKG